LVQYGHFSLLGIGTIAIIEIIVLYSNNTLITGRREIADKLSNGDNNDVFIHLTNHSKIDLRILLIDDIPDHFQARDVQFRTTLRGKEDALVSYILRPTLLGSYNFGNINVFCATILQFIRRKVTIQNEQNVMVYPSLIQLKKYEFLAVSNNLQQVGIKKIRKINQSTDFEHIREYVPGDNYKVINWKASARSNKLMINQYQDERAQEVYCILNMGRTMKMPFEGLSLLDYAVNSSLVMASTALNKGDKAGVITFNNQVRGVLKAKRNNSQLNNVLAQLYNVETSFQEADYERLYINVKEIVKKRSLIFLYTNLEGIESLYSSIKFLRRIAKKHALVVVFFTNNEIKKLAHEQGNSLSDIYVQTIARKLEHDKEQVVLELKKNGIFSVLTDPENLTVNSVNKYLELKARGII
jgi:uncharacterized protein (DUF58 family)